MSQIRGWFTKMLPLLLPMVINSLLTVAIAISTSKHIWYMCYLCRFFEKGSFKKKCCRWLVLSKNKVKDYTERWRNKFFGFVAKFWTRKMYFQVAHPPLRESHFFGMIGLCCFSTITLCWIVSTSLWYQMKVKNGKSSVVKTRLQVSNFQSLHFHAVTFCDLTTVKIQEY